MRAIDTNLLIRLILIDDEPQYRLAKSAIAEDVLIPITVVLEAGWVLLSRYRFTRPVIAKTLAAIFDLPTVHVPQEEAIRWALERHAAGADLGDMLHLIAAGEATAFLTFDRRIAKAAGPTPPIPIETLNPR